MEQVFRVLAVQSQSTIVKISLRIMASRDADCSCTLIKSGQKRKQVLVGRVPRRETNTSPFLEPVRAKFLEEEWKLCRKSFCGRFPSPRSPELVHKSLSRELIRFPSDASAVSHSTTIFSHLDPSSRNPRNVGRDGSALLCLRNHYLHRLGGGTLYYKIRNLSL